MARQSSLRTPALAAAPAQAALRPATRAASDSARLTLVLLIALCQGVLYLCLLPPWQHYDEPTHFEYAWLIANRTGLPHPGSEDAAMRRDLSAAMREYQFYRGTAASPLLTDQPVDVGITELLHPPAYYILVSLPLRLVRHLDLVSQLYVARTVSLALFILTVAVAGGVARDLFPAGHTLRWAAPLAVALIPTFADLMTAVNNDAGGVAVFSLFLWGAVRAIRFGLSWRRLAWMFGTALIAAATKNTASVALGLAPLACVVALWSQRGWRWRRLALPLLTAAIALVVAACGWGDAAGWYRGADPSVQNAPTRAATPAAPLGTHALVLETPAGGGGHSVVNPLVGVEVGPLVGRTITIGGWFWSDQPAMGVASGLVYKTTGQAWPSGLSHPIQVTTTPTFVAWTVQVPERVTLLQYAVWASTPEGTAAPARLYLDGALVVEGQFPAGSQPVFDDASAQAGAWGGRRFTNLVRNASAESAWPRLRPWLDDALLKYIHRSPAQTFAALFDVQRIAPALWRAMVRPALDTFVASYAWSNVTLSDPAWLYLARYTALLALSGALAWAARRRTVLWGSRGPALCFLALVGLLVWGNTILRPLPLLADMYILPAARYTFPAIIVTTLGLVGGWWALWPRRLRTAMTLALLAGLLALNGAAVQTIFAFYYAAPPF